MDRGIAIIGMILLIGAVIFVSTTPGAQNWLSGLTGEECQIDESWYIMYNHEDPYDTWSATLLRDTYGATMVPLATATDTQLNKQGQNLLFIGGSKEFAGKVPWMETWPTLTVTKPGGFPDVYIDTDGTWSNMWIYTPLVDYYMITEGVWEHDYGVIARGYDSTLQRWIVVSIGYSAASTGAGAVICATNWEAVTKGKWLIYEIDMEIWNQNQDVSEWDQSLFSEPNLVAYG